MQVKTPAVSVEATASPPKRVVTSANRKRLRTSLLFLAPAFLIILIFMLGPAIWAVYTSFTNMALTGVGAQAPQWVGLQNFVRILSDGEFLNAFRVSIIYLVGSALIGQALLGLLLALMMQKRNHVFRAILGGIIIACWVIPDVVAGFIWQAFLAGGPQSVLSPGLLNTVIANLTLPQHAWVQEYPLPMIIIANIWRGTAFSMLLYASALESIPQDMYEAASIDGAGVWAKIYHVTLPLIKGSIATDLLLITLATLSDFTLVYVMTGGGTTNNELLTIYQYRQAFQFYQIGYGSAIALLIIIVGAILSLLYIRILRIDI
ncbi:amino acid ABC transporter permease [Ktedonobacter sp. SOSP1-85]|uniref:carbohydrate ABC transporter permease n=1 Tax=unclassified Ktedonobacter TaxID=388461 RepID=UPI0019160B3E|nr:MULTISPECIES: sugar ABC transporter permease [unclassified Ktedonobacter]GHO66744.1 amino acid ABC transporter permease [Ktedonobacter sp. SOSP1-52]GHO74047.1 amino acid ABC transporter permease [Ktedonobacter sp. SOSP1-85]